MEGEGAHGEVVQDLCHMAVGRLILPPPNEPRRARLDLQGVPETPDRRKAARAVSRRSALPAVVPEQEVPMADQPPGRRGPTAALAEDDRRCAGPRPASRPTAIAGGSASVGH